MKDRSKAFIEIVSVVAVVASLLFVGLQLILDRRIAVAAQFHERSLILHDGLISQLENDELVALRAREWDAGFLPSWWNEDIETFKQSRNYSMEDMVRLETTSRMRLLRLNNNYFQYGQGLISEETWKDLQPSAQNYSDRPLDASIAATWNALESDYRNLVIASAREQKD